MTARLENKIAVVVGAGQMAGVSVGTGRATALRFMQEGATVFAIDRDIKSAEETLEIAGATRGKSKAFAADVADTGSLERAMACVQEEFGRVDILFYNVGLAFAGGDRPLDEISDEVFDRLHAINLRGAIMSAKYVVPGMRARKSGVILNLASVAAIETTRPNIAYRTSKAGLIAFTQQLAVQNAPYGVRANSILPGVIDTPMAVDQRVRLLNRPREELIAERNKEVLLRGQMGTGWDIGNAAVFLASDEASFITGVALPVDGGMLARIGG